MIPFFAKVLGDEIIKGLEIDISQLDTLTLDPIDRSCLSYNMTQASAYWNVPSDVIPKRKRLR